MKRSQNQNRFEQSKRFLIPDDLTDRLREKINGLSESIKHDYLKSEVFSKFVSKDTDPPSVRRQRAMNKWLATEADNAATEDRLLTTREDFNILPHVEFSSFVAFCRGVIADIIGDTPPVDALIGAFSGGASTSRPRTSSHPASKYYGIAHITSRCLDVFVDCVVEEVPGWLNAQTSLNLQFDVVPGNVFFTVPKKTDIDRVACKEPDINMFVQKGIGQYFRTCLLRSGINLQDQSINRSWAQVGSRYGKLATLDLSSASDSVSTELVSLLLPETWFTLLDSVRSHVTIIDGEEHRNCMFSSMGNGFTFELESLLFYALMRTTAYFRGTRGVISVYGDDIIIPTELADMAIWVLNYFGFQVNPDKSFVDGPFRESCGGHYWNGVDITPFYVKAPIESMADLIDVANKLRRFGDLCIGTERLSSVVDPEIESIWLWLKSLVPSYLWGGADLSFKYQLVSADTPKLRLSEETKSKGAGPGGYPHWLNATWYRMGVNEAVVTSGRTVSLKRYRLRPVRERTVPRLEAYFLHELG